MPSASPERVDSDAGESSRILALLEDPASYPESTSSVERVDTHISAVFLTDQHAFKLKKRVGFDFLDFRTLPLRLAACEQEVVLNRRLAPGVYLGLTPITRTGSAYAIDGDGEVVDWLVKMRRLPAENALDAKIAVGAVTRKDVSQLASTLLHFYRSANPLAISGEAYLRHVDEHVEGNRVALMAAAAQRADDAELAAVRRIHAAQNRLLRIAPDMLSSRVDEGRVVDGHGDLRPDHIYFLPEPTIIDCIEFNDEFRQMDVVDELAFLAEECEHAGAGWIGEQLLSEYRDQSGDSPSRSLLEFYKSYRATVRAKVAALRAAQVPAADRGELDDDTDRHLELAQRHSRGIGAPLLIVVHGLSGVGKSTLAAKLGEALQTRVLSTDHVRREMFPRGGDATPVDDELYRPENRLQVYGEMFKRADRLLRDRESVILDGTFGSSAMRRAAAEAARGEDATFLLVCCECDAATAVARIKARVAAGHSESDATPTVFHRQQEHFDAPESDLPRCVVDTGRPVDTAVSAVFRELRRQVPWS